MVVLWIVFGVVAAVFLLTALIGAPYVPTHKQQARLAFSTLRPVTKKDTVLDIGSGDGVVLQQALVAGAGKVIGYEINPFLVWVAQLRLWRQKSRVKVVLKNFWEQPFPTEVTVVYTFGESRDIAKMYRRVEAEATRLQRPIDFISYAFAVPDAEYERSEGGLFLYKIIPLQIKKT